MSEVMDWLNDNWPPLALVAVLLLMIGMCFGGAEQIERDAREWKVKAEAFRKQCEAKTCPGIYTAHVKTDHRGSQTCECGVVPR